jgi:glucosyl-3-phosphoglycerate synthase
LKTFINRKAALGMIELNESMFDEMIQYQIIDDQIQPDTVEIRGYERPPMIEIEQYRDKFNIR